MVPLCVYANTGQKEEIVSRVYQIIGIDHGGELLLKMLGSAEVNNLGKGRIGNGICTF